ncbi:MAG TPA: hypothetical protein P5186_15025 [Candidatus Paceibacterota bacterium]|nr:hypothetical protein [Verrucomicrobiota bacterium]HRY49360.1 hypothetical protein [Candidatus Paceibacterota bacterium]HSA01076.1 hypothetical protein [Candidatus Paceibacterota bacterium]
MTNATRKEIVLVVSFVVIIAAPAILQTVIDLARGESIQALAVFQQKVTAKNLRAYEREMEEASWVAKQLRPVMQQAQFRLLRQAGDKAIVGPNGWMFYRPGVRYMTDRPIPPSPAGSPDDPLSAIVAFHNELATRNIQLLVMIAPNKESVYPEMLTRRAKHLDAVIAPSTSRLMEDLQKAGVAVVDLFEAFRAAKHHASTSPGTPLYLAQDSHWSPAGVELAARTAANAMLSSGWIRRGDLLYTEKTIPVRRLGDLIRMLQLPQIEPAIQPELVLCGQIIRQDTQQTYHDSPDAEILVLGDSFLRIYEQDEPQSAGFLAHLARELGQPLASIVNDGGASTLVRQELHRRPHLLARKKMVLWEFVERDIRLGTEGWQVVPLPAAADSQAAVTAPAPRPIP